MSMRSETHTHGRPTSVQFKFKRLLTIPLPSQTHIRKPEAGDGTDLGVVLLVDAVADLDVGVRRAQVRDPQVLRLCGCFGRSICPPGGSTGAGTYHQRIPKRPLSTMQGKRASKAHREDGEHENADGRRVAEPLQIHLLDHGDDQLRGVEEEALLCACFFGDCWFECMVWFVWGCV